MSEHEQFDLVVVGTGAAGLSAALTAGVHGAKTLVLEKSSVLGGTTAMSGGCIWAPGHHHMARLGLRDSREAALDYIRAVSPDGWHNAEEPLWGAFVDYAPRTLKFIETHSPTRFEPNRDPDPYAEIAGGMAFGRNVSPAPIRIAQLGPWRDKIREPTVDLRLSYGELVDTFFFARPKKIMPRLLPRLMWRKLSGARTRGMALTIGLLKGCLDQGVEIWPESPASRLLTKDGRISGIAVQRAGRAVTVDVSRGVILASGGFDWNADMMAELGEVLGEAQAGTDTAIGFSHRVISRRMREVCNSVGRELPSLRAKRPYNPAYMNPGDLADLGLVDGQRVELESSRARVQAIVAASDDVRPGVISMSHAWGAAPGQDDDVETTGTSTARLIDNASVFDPISGIPVQSAIPVNVRPL